MNKQNAQQYIPLVQALAEGKLQIENTDFGWEDVKEYEEIFFSLPVEHYRIKPEPAQVKIWCTPNNEPVSITTRSDVGDTYSGQTVKLFREVI